MKKLYLLIATAAVAVLSFSSCSKELITKEGYKETIKNSVYESTDLMKAQNNQDLLGVINRFAEIQNITSRPTDASLSRFSETAQKLCRTNEPLVLLEFATAIAPFEGLNFTMEYNEADSTWKQAPNENGIEIRYNYNGKQAVWKLSPGKETQSFTLDIKNPADNSQLLYETVVLPKHIAASIDWNGTTQFELEMDLEISSDMQKGKIAIRTNANGTRLGLDLNATPDKISLGTEVNVNRQHVFSLSANLTGQGMTQVQNLFNAAMSGNLQGIWITMKDADAEMRFMDDVVLKGTVRNISEFGNLVNNPNVPAETYAEEMQKLVEKNVSLKFCYQSGKNVIATIDSKLENGVISLYMHFESDGSRQRIEEYFDEAFLNDLQQQLTEMINGYIESLPELMKALAQ